MRAIRFPFQVDLTGKIRAATTYEEVVRGQVIDALMTNQGERVMRPRHGCDIQSALFDPQDELARVDAASMINSRLAGLVPRAIVRGVTIGIEGAAHASETAFTGGGPSAAVVSVSYRTALYATDTTVEMPVSSASEFAARQNLPFVPEEYSDE